MDAATIRDCGPGDYAAIVDIYNHYIKTSHATFDTLPFSLGERVPWFSQFTDSGPHRLLVTEVDGDVAGFCSSTQFHHRPGYAISVETTIYMNPASVGQGLGGAMYAELLAQIAAADIHGAFAAIALPNEASIKLHENLGFSFVGTLPEVGRKQDRYIDVSWYSKTF